MMQLTKRTAIVARYSVLPLITLIAALAIGWGHVGNAGDPLRLLFTAAREHAAFVTNRMHPDGFSERTPAEVRVWILENKQRLAGDILASPHNWVQEQEPTCAFTGLELSSPINLSFPTCRASIQSREEAAKLLIHESVHHFGIADEAFADAVADAIYGAWASGILDWQPTPSSGGVTDGRSQHAATWDGTYMYIYGGLTPQTTISNSLVRFDPANNQWTAIQTVGAEPKYGHQMLLDGKKLIVWGGFSDFGSGILQSSGQILDLETANWRRISGTAATTSSGYIRTSQIAVLAGYGTERKLVVWGLGQAGRPGSGLAAEGGIYDINTDRWTKINAVGAPLRYSGHSVVAAGNKVIVWGGKVPPGQQGTQGVLTNEGAILDLTTNTWSSMSLRNAPSARMDHSAVWTGSKMIVFGGSENSRNIKGSGGIYDLATDTWAPFVSEVASQRIGHSAVWTGDEMLVWGGRTNDSYFGSVIGFQPSTGVWRSLSVASNPTPRDQHTAVWTGMSMIVWGGASEVRRERLATGGLLYP